MRDFQSVLTSDPRFFCSKQRLMAVRGRIVEFGRGLRRTGLVSCSRQPFRWARKCFLGCSKVMRSTDEEGKR
jgi:hypothetical protein